MEAMRNIYSRFGEARKIFAIGLSTGANSIANILGFEGEKTFITAAVSFQPMMDMTKWSKHIKSSLFGIYSLAIAHRISTVGRENYPMI
jgi:predicted alpha/beta-fold hydrolase